MPINAPWNYPTLMCTPPGGTGGVFPTETVLPLEPEAYAVTQEGEIWRVMVRHSGEVLYEGPGPAGQAVVHRCAVRVDHAQGGG